MATTGTNYELTEESRGYAIKYVEESGLFKSRLADFLGISRPTLNKLLDENTDFFTSLKRADSIFCKSLIDSVAKRNPVFLLKTKYKNEFNSDTRDIYDPEVELNNLMEIIENNSVKDSPTM